MSTEDDVEQFAALLRRLKNRTDRSYGSLARRLHMNTSTLHRYCAGGAVPMEYAPVERLAAFCGATPEERLELHRLWLLAAASRQRPRAGDGGGRGDASGPPARPDADAHDSGPPPVDAGPPAPDPGPSTADARPPASDAGPPAPGALGPGRPESSAQGDASRSTGRPWYRRRRTVVGAAAATLLLVTLGSVSALSADRSQDNSAKPQSQSRTAGTGTSPHPSGASGSPEPKGGPSADGNVPAQTGVPLTWTADSQIWDGGCGHDYVIAKEPAQVPPPPVQQDAEAWAATQQAVPGRQTTVQISVQGKSSTAVVLKALRVRVVSRDAPVAGNAYAMGQGCGSDLPPRNFSVNLDVDRPITHARPGNDSGKLVPAVQFPYRVSAEDPEVLQVTATTEAYDCNWYLELDWSSQGRTGTVRIDDHGRPFRTSGIKGRPHYWYGTNADNARQWVLTSA
ncbi:helix-turn-helix domain-containing protein [Streptomyces sp. DSM 15324]|uniref:helix-turn-helix domain-containing protein n=1 Tax=Streptomyces sp. DSM 15324 TaxID=1739111 RepID=UPI00074B179A|nr:helix-turn-helix transcriptional regulator [Streptomyces sp. DSM 15324]KUO08734.1 DNA-binding protein [Streptomyces sp. DSM 15324]